MHQEKVSGFESDDVLTTAKFIQLHNDLLDILNAKSICAPGLKKAITVQNFPERLKIFEQIRSMYDVLWAEVPVLNRRTKIKTLVPKKLIESERRTAFLGLLLDMNTIERLISYMAPDDDKLGLIELKLDFLCSYKLCQDFLEIFFNAIRIRNGWSINPTANQFRWAYRQLMVHAGSSILASTMANCQPQDETSMLMISMDSFCGNDTHTKIETPTNVEFILEPTEQEQAKFDKKFDSIMRHGCKVDNCVFCMGALCYIAGYLPFSLLKVIKCTECIAALRDTEIDPCPKKSLILLKNYIKEEDYEPDTNIQKGLFVPSGSLCKLIFLAEKIFRKVELEQRFLIDKKNAIDHLVYFTMCDLQKDLFLELQESKHYIVTSFGASPDNHMFSFIRLILKKFFALRIKKAKKTYLESGNIIQRTRVFKGV